MEERQKEKILVVDDDSIILSSAEKILKPEGFELFLAKNGTEALRLLEEIPFDLVLSDLRMPDMDGIELLKRIKAFLPSTEVIIITGFGTVRSAVEALKYGAYDYIEKPFTPEHLVNTVKGCLEKKRLIFENIQLRKEVQGLYKLDNIIGTSAAMQRVFNLIAQVAPTNSTVLITGESGTGKELIARAIHYNSLRKSGPFIVVDCCTMPENLIEAELFGHIKGAFTGAISSRKGLLELAHTGTIFFDEIGNLSLSIQAKLLRFLQEREFRPIGSSRVLNVDVRFIAATNKDLLRLVKEGNFREDFFYRLNVFPIKLPPLRERKEDIAALAAHFLKKYSAQTGLEVRHISADAMKILINYDWPGNVRELENVIHRAMILSDSTIIRPEHIQIEGGIEEAICRIPRNIEELKRLKGFLKKKAIEEIEKSFIIDALKRNNYNVTKAAEDVGMQRTNFHGLMKKYNLTTKSVLKREQ
ncbi:MAG: sigma-54-dependent transcriptional regulator [Thermodesulfovibrionales bacterium]